VGDSDYEIAIRLHICVSNTNHFGIILMVPSHVSTVATVIDEAQARHEERVGEGLLAEMRRAQRKACLRVITEARLWP
jgi:hypothetical protein